MVNIKPKDRLKEIFNLTIDSGLQYDGEINNIDFYSLFCKAASNNQLYKLFSCNLSMFKYKFKNEDSILILFSIPVSVNSEESHENKHISERIMNVLRTIEECFFTVEYMNLKEVKEDKFTYMTVIKKISDYV